MLTIDIPPELEAQLRILSSETGQTVSDCAREAIVRLLEDAEDLRIARERAGKPARRWSLDELERGIDLAS
ncbi:anti-toxin [Candidatus Sumerlaeota bacterium]|nr:anti-toxin [Candidatus Sumerlaeota bacterium]MBI3735010.1 anti-toxin [Candidatus Sumerlaeota bacterium]